MTESNVTDSKDQADKPALSGRAATGARVALVETWQAAKKTFAFALAADDYGAPWRDRLTKSADRIRDLTQQDADVALYMMLQTAANDTENYSASHSMYCAVVADLCASYLEFPEAEAAAVRNAALTMNLGMLSIQNSMAQQIEARGVADLLGTRVGEREGHPAEHEFRVQTVAALDRKSVV